MRETFVDSPQVRAAGIIVSTVLVAVFTLLVLGYSLLDAVGLTRR